MNRYAVFTFENKQIRVKLAPSHSPITLDSMTARIHDLDFPSPEFANDIYYLSNPADLAMLLYRVQTRNPQQSHRLHLLMGALDTSTVIYE
jgi:hypothetical protein